MNIFETILSLPKTIYFNMRVFPFKIAIKMPVFVAHNTNIKKIHKGCIQLDRDSQFGMIKIGTSKGPEGIVTGKEHSQIILSANAKLIFKGTANLANGISIRCDGDGIIVFGDRFSCNANCFFASNSVIEFGEDDMLGWNVNIRDSDGHNIYDMLEETAPTNAPKEIYIGSHVWISSCSDILKGAVIPDECIVGYRACVTRKFIDTHCVIAGVPAKVVKKNIMWER